MSHLLFANLFFTETGGRLVLRAMPVLLGALCILAIAYRYYSAFLAARVAALDDSRLTPKRPPVEPVAVPLLVMALLTR